MAWLLLACSAYAFYRVWRAPLPTPNQLARGHKIDRVGLVLVSVSTTAMGAYISHGGIRGLSELLETADWNRVPCKVVRSNLSVERDSGPPELSARAVVRVHRVVDASILKSELELLSSAPTEHFGFDVLYEYSVGGHTYRSRRAGPLTGFSNQDPTARERLARLQTGASTWCWVSPSAPTESIFERRGHALFTFYLAVGSALFVAGCWMTNFSIRALRQ